MGGAFGGFVTGTTATVPAISEIRRTSQPSPVFIDATGDVTVAAGGTQALTVQMLDPSVTAYQWRRDGVNLSDGVQADLSTVSGAGTATLTITNAAPSASAYTVRVTAGTPACFATSAEMVVTVTPGCDPIDFNGDGLFPDSQDITDFLAVFGGGGAHGGVGTWTSTTMGSSRTSRTLRRLWGRSAGPRAREHRYAPAL
jgi:hypothetical protein